MTRRRGVAATLLLAALASACAGAEPIEPAGQESCGAIEEPEIEGQTHVAERSPINYQTDPPTSGPHWPRPAPTGYYDVDIEEGALVHNMEHGQVIVWYSKSIPTEVRNGLKRVVDSDLRRWIMVPYSFKKPDVVVAFTAWGRLQTCTRASDALSEYARAFFRKHAGTGPEGDLPGVPHG